MKRVEWDTAKAAKVRPAPSYRTTLRRRSVLNERESLGQVDGAQGALIWPEQIRGREQT